jgi:hypothetical protein
MTKYLYFAFSDCKDPSREKEFNDWYNDVHCVDMMEVDGFIQATRWASAEPEKPGQKRKYLTLYEVETDDMDKFNERIRERGMRTVKEGRFSDLPVFDGPEIPRVYKQIMPAKKAKKPQDKKV